ncbi:MAG TPA: C39 family peptidase [Patescibacteria group bacterium]|nr:C39 family peptidase [Patescibacteria group bacterium]
MKRIVIFIIALSLLLIFSSPKAFASVIFQDNFDSGDSSQWTTVQGPNLFQVANIDGSNRFGALISSGSTIVDEVAGDITTPNYTVDLDILPIQGVDKNISFRWVNNASQYEVHFNGEGAHFTAPTPVPTIPFFLSNGTVYHFKLILNGPNIKVLVDGNQLFDVTDPTYVFSGHEKVGVRVSTGAAYPTEVWFDNIVVNSIDPGVDLNVPLLKQTNPLWGSLIYDAASSWAGSKPKDISTWGCSLTSAVMVFNYYGINKLPNGIGLTPGTLNKYLQNDTHLDASKDGYIGTGYINWVELSNISKLAKFQNPGFLFDALEFLAKAGQDDSLLTQDINDGHPDILQVPGHFVVAKGIDSNNKFLINDPYYNRTSLSDYSDSYLGMRRFIPANSDLSYVVVMTQDGVSVGLKDSLGNTIGSPVTEYPITNPATGTGDNGKPASFIYLPKPDSGKYSLDVSSTSVTNYSVTVLTYDASGYHKKFVSSGIVGASDTDNYSIIFDKNNARNDSENQNTNFETTLNDISSLCKVGEIKPLSCAGILLEIKTAQNLSKNGKTKTAAKSLLNAVNKELLALQKAHVIADDAYNILHADTQLLLTLI